MSICKLTICFEDPFWIGLVEVEDGGVYSVARHVFGAEPSTPEVFEFVCHHWRELRFTHDVEVEVRRAKRVNPKRLRRLIEKEMRANARRGTKAQQALAEERERAAERGKAARRERKADRADERFAQRTEKRKQKHRGR